METKRCPRCHKLLRADAQICSLCGHNFAQVTYVRRKARTNPDPTMAMSNPSHPPASPHGAGHYSGLHPEDQPYQSSFMVAVRPNTTRRLTRQEPEEDILPAQEDNAPVTPPEVPVPTQQRQVRKTLKLVASPSPLPMPLPQRSSSTSSPTPVPRRPGQPQGSPLHSQRLLERPPAPLRKPQEQGHVVPILLIAACILFLLATSLLAFLLLDGKSLGSHPVVLTPPHLQLAATNVDLGTTGPGGVSNQNVELTNTGEQLIAWQASSDQSWLTISPANGTLLGKTTIWPTISVNRGTLAPEKYMGQITFDQQGSHSPLVTLAVTMHVKPSRVILVVSQASLSYYGSATQNPASQTITVQNKGTEPLDWSAALSTGNNSSWLSINPTQGSLAANSNQAVTISVQSRGLAPGTYQGMITFKGGANPSATVTLIIASPGNLSVSPSSLAFSTVAGQAANQRLVVQNSGGQPLSWTVLATTANGGNWLSVTPLQGYLVAHVAADIVVSANAAALSAGTYQGTLDFSYGGGPSTQVAVSFTVSPPPVPGLRIQPTALKFSSIMGTNPPPQSFLITDSGTAPLDWAISEDPNGAKYIPLTSTHATLAPGKSASITVQPNVSQAGAGTISAVLTVYDSDKGSQVPSQQVTVTMTILNQAQIDLSVNSMSFNQSSQLTKSTELLIITNSGSAVLNWAIAQSGQSQAPWLSVDNSPGTLGPSEAALVNVTCDSSQLSPGTYTAILEVSDTDSGTPVQPQYITVTLIVSS